MTDGDHELLVRLDEKMDTVITQIGALCTGQETMRDRVGGHDVAIARLQDRVSVTQVAFGAIQALAMGVMAWLGARKP